MTRHIDGKAVELTDTAGRLVSSDDRTTIDAQKHYINQVAERRAEHEQLRQVWEQSGISEDFSELAEVLGSRIILSKKYEFRGPMSFMTRLTIPRPLRLGARLRDIDKVFQIGENNHVASLVGNILFYRVDRGDEEYAEHGFYAFALRLTNGTAPCIVWGDIGATQWDSEAWKIQLERDLCVQPQHHPATEPSPEDFFERSLIEKYGVDLTQFYNSLFATRNKGLLRNRSTHGVLRQNQTPAIDLAQEHEILRDQMRYGMQCFIDNVYKPLQTNSDVIDHTVATIEDARLAHEAAPLLINEFDIARALVSHIKAADSRGYNKTIIEPTGLPKNMVWGDQLPSISRYPGVKKLIQSYNQKRRQDYNGDKKSPIAYLLATMPVQFSDIEYQVYRELKPDTIGRVFPFD